ncbi:BA75_02446T0 [Komagataella pastoris]|uniref:BA75_02446T0 n=1 Tax=Komagataella pastoris TaxID=4922 RepID=A0A1B2JDH5_PICPA|nr:BA75_02446T0 [Komagataella pastoris]
MSVRHFSTSKASFIFKLGSTLNNIKPEPFKVVQVTKPVGLFTKPEIFPLAQLNNHKSPSKTSEFWAEFKSLFNKEKREAKRLELEEEMRKGGLYDMHTYRVTKGKVFLSPISYFKESKSLYFPNLVVTNLKNETSQLGDVFKNKVTVLKIHSTQEGFDITKEYFNIKNSTENYLTESGYQILNQEFDNVQIAELNLVENGLKGLISKLSLGHLRKIIPDSRHDSYFSAKRSLLPMRLREDIFLRNLYTGYVYVVDQEGKIRWLGCGKPTEKDHEMLWKAVKGVSAE